MVRTRHFHCRGPGSIWARVQSLVDPASHTGTANKQTNKQQQQNPKELQVPGHRTSHWASPKHRYTMCVFDLFLSPVLNRLGTALISQLGKQTFSGTQSKWASPCHHVPWPCPRLTSSSLPVRKPGEEGKGRRRSSPWGSRVPMSPH